MRIAANLPPKLRRKIGVCQKSGGWKGRVWGRRAEIRPAATGAWFVYRVLLNRRWIEGEAPNLWAALDKIGAAEPQIKIEGEKTMTTKTKTKTKTAKAPKAAKPVKISKAAAARAEKAAAKKAKREAAYAAGPGMLGRGPKPEKKVRLGKRGGITVAVAPPPPTAAVPAVDTVQTDSIPATQFGPVGAKGGQSNFFGVRTTSALQRLGAMGFTVAEATLALAKFGGTAATSTVRTFVTAGRGGGKKGHKMAEFGDEATAQLRAFLAQVRATAPAASEPDAA